MNSLKTWRKIWSDSRGDTGFVEWLLLVGLIAIAGFVAFNTVGQNVSTKATDAANKIGGLNMQ